MLGEETVLLKALEGKRGQPEQRPPHPAERGPVRPADPRPQRPDPGRRAVDRARGRRRVHGDRHVAAARARSSSRSARPAARTASPRSRSGTPLRDVLALGGKLPAGRTLKAVLVGGPSGGLLPPDVARHALRLRAAARGRRPPRVRLGRRRRRPDRPARARRRADPLLLERGVRQVDPVPDRHQAPGRDRRRAARTACCARSTPSSRPTWPPTSSPRALCDHERLATLPLTSGMRYFGSDFDPARRPQPASTEASR